jgi:hypothetical protein
MQHLLLLVITLVTVGLIFTVTRWPGGMHMTFSQHAATSRWSKIYYALLFLVTLPLLMWFFVGWFVPDNNLPDTFLWFAGVAVLFQIICTWVPEEGGIKTTVHRTLTGISGIIALKNQKGFRWALLLQVGYYATFFIILLTATYS